MIRTQGTSRLLWPSVFTGVALVVLIGLGTWQWQRKNWKERIISRLEVAARASPKDYAQLSLNGGSGLADRYVPVRITGRFRHDQEVHVFWTRGNTPGFLVLTPMVPPRGRPILVNRGFVPFEFKAARTRSAGQRADVVTVTGLLVHRDRRPSVFTPAPEPAQRTWYAIQPTEMDKVLDLGVVHDYTIDADATPNPGGWPKGRSIAARIAEIPNRHLEYALTWWGLAATLVGVFIAFAMGRGGDNRA